MSHRPLFERKNVLITGGAGFIGSHLCDLLISRGDKVTVIDNFMYQQSGLNHVCNNPNFSVVKGDIRIESIISPLIKKADMALYRAKADGRNIYAFFDPTMMAQADARHHLAHDVSRWADIRDEADALARHGRADLSPKLQMPLTPARMWSLLQTR